MSKSMKIRLVFAAITFYNSRSCCRLVPKQGRRSRRLPNHSHHAANPVIDEKENWLNWLNAEHEWPRAAATSLC
jgi:hypothetical protein